MVGSLQTKREALMTALQAKAGQWMKRKDIATQLGASALSRDEVVILHTMAEQGTIEIRQEQGRIPDTKRYEYRVSGE